MRCWRGRPKALDAYRPYAYTVYMPTDTPYDTRIRAYRRQAAADALGVSATQVDRLVLSGRLQVAPVDVIGGPDLIDADSLHALLAERGRPIPD